MNNFNTIFQTIKVKIEKEQKAMALCPELIARETSIRLDQVEFYVNCLEHLGYIKLTGNKTIELTPKGKTEEKIF